MKSKMVAMLFVCMTGVAHCFTFETSGSFNAGFYTETGAGIAGGEPVFTIRTGNKLESLWDLSLGYMNILSQTPDNLLSKNADLPTINAEALRVLPLPGESYRVLLGGGLGYTMPNLASGINERAENGASFTLTGALETPVNDRIDVKFTVRGFFFDTKTTWRRESYHLETVYQNGSPIGQVSVTDEHLGSNSVNFNTVTAMVSILWK